MALSLLALELPWTIYSVSDGLQPAPGGRRRDGGGAGFWYIAA